MIISLISVALNIVLSLYLMRIFGHVGLALATVLVSWMGLCLAATMAWARRPSGKNACSGHLSIYSLFGYYGRLIIFSDAFGWGCNS
jgi:peptidoglycan biosynthesis protein MviN/MurJ (putative lipid II flippase)